MTRTRLVVLCFVAVLIAGVCIRLGIWQLDRLAQRRAENARVAAGLAGAPVEIASVGTDSTRSRALRVRLRGRYDFANEIILINRSRDGSPGVNLLTPVRLEDGTAVIVNRGWVYSPDGATIDPARWREPENADGTAYVSWLPETAATSAGSSSKGSAGRRVSHPERRAIAEALPYPVAPFQLILLDSAASLNASTADAASRPLGTAEAIDRTRPIRLPPPALDEGPHKSYAIQWFSFAAIALIGTGAVAWKERARAQGPTAL